jgi:leucyl-tRNA synthetase
MEERYNPEQIEAAAQRFWDETRAFKVTEDRSKEKFYCLSMFPYPSGRLHMGHVRNYTIGDVISRYQRMLGKNVLQPMGWDAFGLPAENAAIQNNVPAAQWTYENIDYMRGQLKRMGFGYDWDREFATCDPDYYRWEQWLLTRLHGKGLMYKRNAEVNWDPVEQTVLANEQVDSEGRGWRSGALVERREIPHWFLKITDYAEELDAALDELDGWPDEVRKMQRDWVGRSEGAEIVFELADGGEPLTVYTTRADTLLGATYMAVAAGHPLALTAAASDAALAEFVEECRRGGTSQAAIDTMEKRGRPLGIDAVHPITGETLPVWVANFVLMGYGTGAVMAVPGHDTRDHAFATQYGLAIKQVIAPADGTSLDIQAEAYVEDGVVVNSGEFDALSSAEAREAIAAWLAEHGHGRKTVNYRLRDWGISRQRYWGCPVPMIDCGKHGARPVPQSDLPVVLPEDVAHVGHGSPLAQMPGFFETTCPEDGEPARRETDTLDTFVESSWYYARFAAPGADAMLDERANYWLPVDQYVGGIEHAVLHLLYARFFHRLMRDEGLVDSDEPFTNLLCQGMVVAETFYRDADGKRTWYAPADVEMTRDDKGKVIGAKLLADGDPVAIGRVEKMSKSKNNGVDPQAMVERYGADTVRLYMMFTSPPDQKLEWSDSAVEGASRFLKRLWKLTHDHLAGEPPPVLDVGALDDVQRELRRAVHETIAKVGDDVGRRYTFNTAIAATMELFNALARFEDYSPQGRAVVREGLDAVVRMLAPIVPHACHVLWRELGHETPVIDAAWPAADQGALSRAVVELVVQVNGKLRGRVEVSAAAAREEIERLALENENVRRFVDGRAIRKTIVVPGKLVNVVV